jgi:serpin B
MTITNVLTWLITILLMVGGCEKENQTPSDTPKPIHLPEKSGAIITEGNTFGIDLFREVAMASDENLMLSPLSASAALTMLRNGAEGNTAEEIHLMLGYDGQSLLRVNDMYQNLMPQLEQADPEVELAIANGVFYRDGFAVKKPFLDVVKNSFSAEIEGMDFEKPAALKAINGWAKKNTKGKIPKVMDQISADAMLFLMNALYFKGSWTNTFDKNRTRPAPFFLSDGTSVQVNMMNGTIPARSALGANYSAIELTYNRGNFAMVLILPENDLGEMIENFSGNDWQQLTGQLDAAEMPRKLAITMPRFSFEYEEILNDALKTLGMEDAFNASADLSGISASEIFVSFVKQNTFVEVNEEGTEAAAVTSIGIEVTSMPPAFTVNKPFIFAIRERTTNTLLFIGKVEQPDLSN